MKMTDISVLYLSWVSRIPGMGNHNHTHEYWHFTLLPPALVPTAQPEEGARAVCYPPGAINWGGRAKNAERPGVNVMFLVHDKSLYRRLEEIPFHQLTEEQLHMDVLMDMVRRIRELQPDQQFVDCAFSYYLQLILSSYQKSMEKGTQADSLARQAVAFIEENYMRQLRLEDVAEHIGRTTYHTSHLVKESTGKTVVEHVREVRIKNACRMLAYSDTPIDEIVSACGFGSAGYFHRAFRAAVGTTPARYRTSHMVRHTFYEGDEAALDVAYTQDYFTYIPGAQKCICWKTPREYFEQKPGEL